MSCYSAARFRVEYKRVYYRLFRDAFPVDIFANSVKRLVTGVRRKKKIKHLGTPPSSRYNDNNNNILQSCDSWDYFLSYSTTFFRFFGRHALHDRLCYYTPYKTWNDHKLGTLITLYNTSAFRAPRRSDYATSYAGDSDDGVYCIGKRRGEHVKNSDETIRRVCRHAIIMFRARNNARSRRPCPRCRDDCDRFETRTRREKENRSVGFSRKSPETMLTHGRAIKVTCTSRVTVTPRSRVWPRDFSVFALGDTYLHAEPINHNGRAAVVPMSFVHSKTTRV